MAHICNLASLCVYVVVMLPVVVLYVVVAHICNNAFLCVCFRACICGDVWECI